MGQTRVQQAREMLANCGVEQTPLEAASVLAVHDKIYDISYERYLYLCGLSDDRLLEMASAAGMPAGDIRLVVDVAVSILRQKYG